MSAKCNAPVEGHTPGSQREQECPQHGTRAAGQANAAALSASARPTSTAVLERPSLNDAMEFDSAYYVTAQGTVEHADGEYAPSFIDDECDDPDWEPLSGFTGQHGYNGPVMHQSEYIGGALEQYMWDNPGTYAIVEATVTTDEDGEDLGMGDWDDPPAGWVILRKKEA